MLLTESEQFKHISALLYRVTSKGRGPGEGVAPKKVLRNGNLVGKIFIFKDFGWDLIPLLFDFFFLVKLAGLNEKRRETGKDPVSR